ncbi:hypothetical protein MY8738_001206 [Beauveria namnaoensis]
MVEHDSKSGCGSQVVITHAYAFTDRPTRLRRLAQAGAVHQCLCARRARAGKTSESIIRPYTSCVTAASPTTPKSKWWRWRMAYDWDKVYDVLFCDYEQDDAHNVE